MNCDMTEIQYFISASYLGCSRLRCCQGRPLEHLLKLERLSWNLSAVACSIICRTGMISFIIVSLWHSSYMFRIFHYFPNKCIFVLIVSFYGTFFFSQSKDFKWFYDLCVNKMNDWTDCLLGFLNPWRHNIASTVNTILFHKSACCNISIT